MPRQGGGCIPDRRNYTVQHAPCQPETGSDTAAGYLFNDIAPARKESPLPAPRDTTRATRRAGRGGARNRDRSFSRYVDYALSLYIRPAAVALNIQPSCFSSRRRFPDVARSSGLQGRSILGAHLPRRRSQPLFVDWSLVANLLLATRVAEVRLNERSNGSFADRSAGPDRTGLTIIGYLSAVANRPTNDPFTILDVRDHRRRSGEKVKRR